jgi:hypothetical protein
MFNFVTTNKKSSSKSEELACFRIGRRGYAGNINCENVRTPAR